MDVNSLTPEQASDLFKILCDAVSKAVDAIKAFIEKVVAQLRKSFTLLYVDIHYTYLLHNYEAISKAKDKAWIVRVTYRIKSSFVRRYYQYRRCKILRW